MSIIGCDLHSRYQVIAMLETETGEVITRRLEHENGEAKAFYAGLAKPALIGIEATGYTQWFERMVAELGHELWVGDPAEIRARAVRRQKTDTRDAEHLLDLLVSRIPARLGAHAGGARPAATAEASGQAGEDADLGEEPIALSGHEPGGVPEAEAVERAGPAELEGLSLGPWASRRRQELLELLDRLGPRIEEMDRAVKAEAARRPEAVLLMEQKGVGPVTALAFVLTVGPVERFANSRKLVSYLGLNPSEAFQRRSAAAGAHQQARQ